MNQFWGWPTQTNYVRGFESVSPFTVTVNPDGESVHTCTSLTEGIRGRILGYADAGFCPSFPSYPSPAVGLRTPVDQYSLNVPYYPCPANSRGGGVCFSDNGTPFTSGTCSPDKMETGAPLRICSTCLSYYRSLSNDIHGPPGYDHCPYSETEGVNWFCPICPFPVKTSSTPFDAAELTDDGALILFVVLSSLIPFTYIVENISFLLWASSVQRKVKTASYDNKAS